MSEHEMQGTRKGDEGHDSLALKTRLTLRVFLACAVAIATPIAARAAGIGMEGPVLAVAVALTAWTITAVVLARRAETFADASMVEAQHLLMWATATLAHLFAGLTAILVHEDGTGTVYLWWAHIVVLFCGWALIHPQVERRIDR